MVRPVYSEGPAKSQGFLERTGPEKRVRVGVLCGRRDLALDRMSGPVPAV